MIRMRVMLLFILAIMMISVTNGVFGQLIRNFPADTSLGKLTKFEYPQVVISKKVMYLSAGGQIRDKNNLIVLPSMLNDKGWVRYQLDGMGNLHRIWFLTPEETELAKIEQDDGSNKFLKFIKESMPF